jgi:hypothetical protein
MMADQAISPELSGTGHMICILMPVARQWVSEQSTVTLTAQAGLLQALAYLRQSLHHPLTASKVN